MKHEIKEGVQIIYMDSNLSSTPVNTVLHDLVFQNNDPGVKKVVFDLSNVNYVNSAVLGIFLSIASKLKNTGGQLVLCGLNAQVQKLFKTTNVESVFHIQPNLAAALEFLNPGK